MHVPRQRIVPARSRRVRRGGTIYILTLGTGFIVAVLGLTAISLVGAQRRQTNDAADVLHAQHHANTAIRMGLLRIKTDPNWRTTYTQLQWETQVYANGHSFVLEGIDPNDNDLADASADPVLLIGIGKAGNATQRVSVLLEPAPPEALDSLRTAVHAAQILSVTDGGTLTVSAPASTNATLQVSLNEQLHGAAECETNASSGVITGTITTGAPPKTSPDSNVFNHYQAKATVLSHAGDMKRVVISPTYNDYGGSLNTDGVYYVNLSDEDLVIENSRIHGTLVIDAGSNKVIIEEQALLHRYRPDFPVLIVKGNLEIRTSGASLTEVTQSTNYNPWGAQYYGAVDFDLFDTYPNEIQGLIHATGNVTLSATSRIHGVIISEGTLTCNGQCQVEHDSDLYSTPPEGYSIESGKLLIAPRSWTKLIN